MGLNPVFIAITDTEGKTYVGPAPKYQEYAYNKYFAIKQQSNITRDKRYTESNDDMNINYIVRSDYVEFNIQYEIIHYEEFNIKDFNEVGPDYKSFCILVNSNYKEYVLSNNEHLLRSWAI